MPSDDDALQTFVADRYPRLRRSAFLMGGDWELAGEQARATLTRLVTDSDRGHVDDADAYAWSDIMHSCRHRPGKREHVFVAAPDGEGEAPDTILVLDALHRLAPRCRSVLVLRQFDGFTVGETADLLGLSDERVEAYEAAGLGALEVLLADTIPAPEPPAEEPAAGVPGQEHTQRPAAEVPGRERTQRSVGESDVPGQEGAEELAEAAGESTAGVPGREPAQRPGGGLAQESTGEAGTATAGNR
jgi:DNA-directed RNA polymerase specialized sigma24 family protein